MPAATTSSLSSSYIHLSKRFPSSSSSSSSSSFSTTKPILRPSLYLSHYLQPFFVNSAACMTSIRRRFNHSYSDYDEWSSSKTADIFPVCDYKHWSNVIGLPGVLSVLPDCYVDRENKDYGVSAELYVNGEIVQRSPVRQMRVELFPPRALDIPSDDDPDSLCQTP